MRPLPLVFALCLAAGSVLAASPALRAQSADPGVTSEATNPPLPSPKPAPEDPRVRKLAVQQFLAWQTGTVNRDLYADSVNNQLSDEVLQGAATTLARLGALQQATFQGISTARGSRFYVYGMACENGSVKMEFSLDAAGKIALIFFE